MTKPYITWIDGGPAIVASVTMPTGGTVWSTITIDGCAEAFWDRAPEQYPEYDSEDWYSPWWLIDGLADAMQSGAPTSLQQTVITLHEYATWAQCFEGLKIPSSFLIDKAAELGMVPIYQENGDHKGFRWIRPGEDIWDE